MSAPAIDIRKVFAATAAALSGAHDPDLATARHRAVETFVRHGWPTPRVEAWKFTNLNPVAGSVFGLAAEAAPSGDVPEAVRLPAGSTHRVVFIQGRFRPELSALADLPPGVEIASLAGRPEQLAASIARDADTQAGAVAALNGAFVPDGALVRVAPGIRLERPIELLFLGAAADSPWMIAPRNLVTLGAGASATLLETYGGSGRYWTNAVTEVEVEAGAHLQHLKLQAEAATASHLALTRVRLLQDADYANILLAHGAILARNEIEVVFAGAGGRCRLDGVQLARGRQHLDATIRVDHAAAHCSSSQLYKNVVDDAAHAVFQGRIGVAVDAQKSDARQTNRTLLLSDTAQCDSKPELEILADDVKCSHGATVGDLDRQELFYLRARGLDLATARALLIEAFAAEVLEGIGAATARDHMRAHLARWLAGAS